MTALTDFSFAGIARALRAMLGAPDYARYLEHARTAHPDREPMTCEQFLRDRLDGRYNRPGSRCC